MLRYAITNLSATTPDTVLDAGHNRRMRLQADLHRWAEEGIDFVQLREKELEAGEILSLAEHAMRVLQAAGRHQGPRLLINGRPDIAAAARADGVHLTARPGELHPEQVRQVFRAAGLPRCIVSVSCHTLEAVAEARDRGADVILFSPVFEKRVARLRVLGGVGLENLAAACSTAGSIPVLALGGIDLDAVDACLTAGAAGVAGIRLFGGGSGPA